MDSPTKLNSNCQVLLMVSEKKIKISKFMHDDDGLQVMALSDMTLWVSWFKNAPFFLLPYIIGRRGRSASVVYGHSRVSICGGAMRWSYRKSRDVSHRKYVLRMRNRKLRHIRPSGPDRKYVLRVPGFSPRFFFLVVVTWLPKVTWPLRGSLECTQPKVAQHP